jgi:putative NIF3 family GTP cyclohydrolase 1 type 2
MNSVLLTVDLTHAVAAEAIENKYCCVIAYHPIIFRGLKSLTLADSQQSSLLRLALEGISVYCPHTAVDAVPGGMADWLCDIVTGTLQEPQPKQQTSSSDQKAIPAQTSHSTGQDGHNGPDGQPDLKSKAGDDGFSNTHPPSAAAKATTNRPHMNRSYSRPTYPGSKTSNPNSTPLEPSRIPHTRSVIHPSPDSAISLTHNPSSFPSDRTGSGRLITFQSPQPLTHLIEHIASGVGNPKGFPVAIPQSCQVEDIAIKTVGICPGSGAGVVKDCGADLIFTGELSHHDALAVTERGGSVVTLFHSNSERGYLHSVMKRELLKELEVQWGEVREEYLAGKSMPGSVAAVGTGGERWADGDQGGDGASEELQDALADDAVRVGVSTVDRDPYGIVVLQGSEVEGIKI